MSMETTDLSALRRDTKLKTRRIAADYVADGLREAIQSGRLADGAVLSQAAIAEHFEVSRVPVREAMRQLLAEGLIQWQAHHVAVVRTLSPERIGELFDHRALLEGYITERAVPLIDAAAISSLRSKNEQMREIADHERWLKANGEFHDVILAVGGDETGFELIEWLRSRSRRYVRMWSGPGELHRPEEAGREHDEIVRLIELGDAPGARAAVEAHVRHTGERLVAYGRAREQAAVADGG
ncbi:MAG: GntR family transcriptional regulator [Actinobacteria bacterium]|nr:GntR family transcriptional regulator [Actinomycetota bacterium]